MAVASSISYVSGLNAVAMNLGAVLPDLVEMVPGLKLKHRGMSHSLMLHGVCLILFWNVPYFRDVWLGVLIGHLFCDALTVSGIPMAGETGMRATLFGGKIRTGTMGELVFVCIVAGISFLLIGNILTPVQGETGRRDWKALYEQGVIDKREYHEKRFTFF
jgi:inner membrane protein